MGAGGSAQRKPDEAQMTKIVERFNYLDENHDGKITLAELEGYHREFDAEFDEERVRSEFKRLDSNGDGSIVLSEYLASQGIDVKTLAAEEIERARQEELAREARILEEGVAAVEIVPDGSESQAITVEAVDVRESGATADAIPAAVAVVAQAQPADGGGLDSAAAVAVEAVPAGPAP